ncbi:TolC family protein [Thiohalocapsa marina]|uniref:TolC family protein n=2 Tax=Thiohalocapsa marina TaxID=424902 RepID=A0A5M8FLP1_9GAMM|nr:TolC family protein [Thiohalocapsa marina]
MTCSNPLPVARRAGTLARLVLLAVLALGLASVGVAGPFGAVAHASTEPLPSPLTLEQALGYAAGHPRVLLAPGSKPASFPLARRQPLFLGCHALAFSGTRGRDDQRDVAWSGLVTAEAAQRLEIRQRFFDVLLADLSYARDNEALAVAFIQFDRASVRAELGQFSPLQVAELEAEYQLILRQRAASEASQRLTRSLLAQALGRPDDLPAELVTPDLTPPPASEASPALEAVVQAAVEHNPRVRQLLQDCSDAECALIRMDVQQQALELLTRLDLLRVIAEQARVESDWRDLKLDESRTMYELEVKADLGFSMSQQTRARRDEEQAALCRDLTRAELAALQGRPTP